MFLTSSGLPTAAAIGGITPVRPPLTVLAMYSAPLPPSQSLSVRLGKPLLAWASNPWHWAQLLTNSRSPMPIACASRASSAAGMALNLA